MTLLNRYIVKGGLLAVAFSFAAPLTGISTVPTVGAQESDDPTVEKLIPSVDKNKPMLIQADDLIYDNKNNRVIARGNVEIYYNNYTLLANDVIYDRGTSKLVADGNVRIKEPDGALVKAERIVLTDDFKEGFIRSLQVVTTDETRIGATQAIRRPGNVTEFKNGVFTPCKVCEDSPKKAPLWRIKAKRVIHNKEEKTISYEDATFDIFGTSIAYLPFFKHPDQTAKRQSGFLIPRPIYSKDLGGGIETPYFFNLAPNYDFTFSPSYLSKRGFLLKGEWRHRLKNGSYNIKVAGISETDRPDDSPSDDKFRGSIVSEGDFKIASDWDFGWDVTYESDDTFRRFYKLDNIKREDRVSKIYLVGQKDRNYFSANAYSFGGLLADDTTQSESIVHPVIDYNYIYSDPVLGGELSFNANALSLTRDDDGVDSSRLSADISWRRKFVDGLGQVITPFAKLRGDIYTGNNYRNPETGNFSDDTETRGVASGGLEYRFPLVAHTQGASHVLEPIAQVVTRTDLSRKDQLDVSNEDAQSLVFDDTLLFDLDKFSGYDRIETGTRANIGIQYTLQNYTGGYMRAVFGQSYHLDGDNAYALDSNRQINRSGLQRDESDFVGGLYLKPNDNLTLVAQSRFDDKEFELQRQDVYASFRAGPLSGGLNYAFVKGDTTSTSVISDEQEILANARLKLTQYWSLIGGIRYDIEDDFRVSDYVGLEYSDECFSLSVSYNESFIDDRDVDPDQSVKVFFTLKHLGSFGTQQGISNSSKSGNSSN
ncbi:MAG: LPS-assembly protein LptD [Methyloligella sp.]|nr:MAG: LPS-assembly protein LptD [Methyloligella sp.]